MKYPTLRSLTLSILAFGLTGCAIKTPYLNISQWPITKRAMYYRDPLPYRIGVLPLTDHRPAHEQQGKRPFGLFLLLWNRRVGDYYTGDHVFGGNVAERLTEQVSEYLISSNAFAEVIRTSPPQGGLELSDASRISALGREHVVDYLLSGELHHFFGSQSQHTSIFLLPLYFINTFGWQDSKTLPWGNTAIQFVLYDGKTGDITWRRLVEANKTLPRDTDPMSEAALESFADVAGQLATDLRELRFAPGQTSGQ